MTKKQASLPQISNKKDHLSWSDAIEQLYVQQLNDWPLARNHYHQLEHIERRTFNFGTFSIDVQHNAARARSTFADLSPRSIEQRPCFLCTENLPSEQKGLLLRNSYLLLINPYPIFDRHLTISDLQHCPQLIENRIADMLSIAKNLEAYTIFYNGPECGASAPDHFHFQAVVKKYLPVNAELKNQQHRLSKQVDEPGVKVFYGRHSLRDFVLIESEQINETDRYFRKFVAQLPLKASSPEPGINLLANYENGIYQLIIFPRKARRPKCFYSQGAEQLLVSPASVELAGILVTPRKEDFEKIDKAAIIGIFDDTSLSIETLNLF
ncbi:DUF4922 domain-containing protein [Roseimarinus sediminis]|uniref:DUF4922 domain-containing protein n=1 Tax=Roseimarinus sediminis TaxID=1610899 RepID=UPI003D1DE7C7